MKVLLVGSGVIGVTAAYCLAKRGHQVTVLDREESSGRGASFANGSLLTPSMSEPWNSPGSSRVLLASLCGANSPLRVRWRTLPTLARWGATFLRHSNAKSFERNTRSNLQLALYSLKVLDSIARESGVEYSRAARGSLRIFRDSRSLDVATEAAERMRPYGLEFWRLTVPEMIHLEPALDPVGDQLAGAIHYQIDQVGDAHQFCVGLTRQLQRQGVAFHFRTEVTSLEVRAGKITGVVSHGRHFEAERYLIAAGSDSSRLLASIGLELLVRPVKGYSVTFDTDPESRSLLIPVVDDHLHVGLVPIAGALRVVGTAEFAGFDRSLDPNRVRQLVQFKQALLPEVRVHDPAARPWCGLRPVSADGVPLMGSTPFSNLWVSTGHGHLGWTLAAGSAQFLADLMSDGSPAIDPALYDPSRFASVADVHQRSLRCSFS